jgi:uncharacterized protein (TIGR03118 family)
MRRIARTFGRLCALATLVGLSACEDKAGFGNFVVPPTIPNAFVVTPLVGDNAALGAPFVDAHLINPWGIAFGPTGLLWVANNGTGTATVYSATGEPQSLVVNIPAAPPPPPTVGHPTGVVFNPTTDFAIAATGPAAFIFATEDGNIAAWNTSAVTDARIVATHAGAVYKALTIASNGGKNFIYATDFHNGLVDVYDATFTAQPLSSFTDPTIPAGFAPFGIQNVAGKLFVTYAKKQPPPNDDDDEAGVGNGFVVVFNPDGTVAQRFASNGSLNSPWGIAVAPTGFGPFAGAILIGNFGDGKIGAYNAATGAFMDLLRDANGTVIAIDGLWGLQFGPTSTSTTLYFASGPGDEAHGLVGTITPAIGTP